MAVTWLDSENPFAVIVLSYGVLVYDMVELVDLFPTLVQLSGHQPLETCTDNVTTTCTEGKR